MNPDSFINPNNFFSTVQLLVGGQITGPNDGPISEYTFHEDQTPPTDAEVDTKLAELNSDFDAQEYARNRASTFPSLGDQLDMQYWDQVNGTTTWKDAIAKVKSDNPKE